MAKTLTTLLAALWLTATLAACASASLYCTSPVASTVWTAGRSQTISWTDDKAPPRLAAYGALDIELLSGADDENPVATLARGVDASARSCSAWVSPAWGPNGSD
ncbi:hypothetical protein PsYK624_085790 [Phanerochaete sordida]|uniref:Yeast cell wall synthesis Kre9/Knh1-like N-terminal domain-containing protein n=1 Tax=Phanerochaete sordida TaxID=48140 RepID=A0A9P3LEN1_9APHY|nr:hypothetical protein PsYK624_085790 [Phanerochaete sordida]